MHSRRLDWVLGVALFISSASRMFVNTGPFLNVNAAFSWLKKDSPVTSLGSRSGVNCTLSNAHPIDFASAFARTVLPVPGTSSRSTCPPAATAASRSLVTSLFPIITFDTFSSIFANIFFDTALPISIQPPVSFFHVHFTTICPIPPLL
jgi:hypothetical protein